MQHTANGSAAATPRQIADAYVETLSDLDPIMATYLGNRPGQDALPDMSPDGHAAVAEAQRATLVELDAAEAAAGGLDALPDTERRAARLLRERLDADLALFDAGEHLREVSNIFSPVTQLISTFQLLPTATPEDWAVIGRRMRNVPGSVEGYIASLSEGLDRGLPAAARQARTVVGQIDAWLAADWYRDFVTAGPASQSAELTAAAGVATDAMARLRSYFQDTYLASPLVTGAPDGSGRERYLIGARRWTGSDLDLADAYAFGWDEYHRLEAEMRAVAAEILPGESVLATLHHLEEHGEAVEGEDAIRGWLQDLTDEAIDSLAGRHFDIAPEVRRVETRIAPPGSAAAPYYTRPSLDFSRPGRTWLPTMGMTRFPVWHLVSTWYHEGAPGHHLQLAHWVHVQDQLSQYQVSVGGVSASSEGWALYAERLMDELGYLTDPARRMGCLSAQMLRAVRVIIDIGMHVGLRIPEGESFHPGEVWTPELALEFFMTHTGHDEAYSTSELTRYLSMPGQAISYKLGERAWLAGRETARAAALSRGETFDLKSWHMAALSLGSLGLDDLAVELPKLR
ncbi:DUF885 domain-containing protein [Streptomyces sp. 4N509B]|uniref:DUF885 domain-containing protein n=1 Tax=Streptomyces sp. 4N509B TaxID=3457413 RepID=UPI003FCF2491